MANVSSEASIPSDSSILANTAALSSDGAQLSASLNSATPAQDKLARQKMAPAATDATNNLPPLEVVTSNLPPDYLDYDSTGGASAGISLTPSSNINLDIVAGADSFATYKIGNKLGVATATYTDGKLSAGIMTSALGYEELGSTNKFNDYSAPFMATRSSAPEVKYQPSHRFSIGITSDGAHGGSLPDAIEADQSVQLSPTVALNLGADVGLNQSTEDANIAYSTAGNKISLAADVLHSTALQSNSDSLVSVEGTYQFTNDVSMSARVQSTGQTALAARIGGQNGPFVQGEVGTAGPSLEVGWQSPI